MQLRLMRIGIRLNFLKLALLTLPVCLHLCLVEMTMGIHGACSENRDESFCPSPSTPRENFPEQHEPRSSEQQAIVRDAQWQFGVTANFSQFFQTPPSLTSPWETGAFAEIVGRDTLWTVVGIAFMWAACAWSRWTAGWGHAKGPHWLSSKWNFESVIWSEEPSDYFETCSLFGALFQVAYKVEERCNTGDYKPIASHWTWCLGVFCMATRLPTFNW